ncbi:conserved hypothetical protein [Anaerolinea thermolimosa]|uniref:lysylphosphatidylglycerol synthase transmembrane domain-containing protein n=1 Tax=Anaerolinea thermolimosa TaxID=229919 RepID=UPI000783C582|nr:lysylphosphatidylglycerol synthase transmembrane domain-containing protein [Anaerolinea thermolimosa]GAP07199.1 conserved hypothetical protein [Anaerolinea thermolimosa]
MRKFIIALILLLGVLFLITRFTEMQDVVAIFQRGNFYLVSLALVFQLLWLFNLGLTYQSIFSLLHEKVGAMYMARVATASMFIGVVAPSGGLSGGAYLLANARSQGRSIGRAAVAGVLFVLLEYTATLLTLIFGLAELARRNKLHWSEITASLILLLGALGLALLLYLGMKSASLLARLLAWGARMINRLFHPFLHHNYLSEARAHSFAFEAAEGIAALRSNPRQVLRPVFHAILNKGILIGILALVFMAFKIEVPFTTVLACFSIAYLFLIVSPTPAGIGVVEGVMTVAFGSLQVPLEASAVVTMAYRGLTFWVPVLLGLFAFRSLHLETSAPLEGK